MTQTTWTNVIGMARERNSGSTVHRMVIGEERTGHQGVDGDAIDEARPNTRNSGASVASSGSTGGDGTERTN